MRIFIDKHLLFICKTRVQLDDGLNAKLIFNLMKLMIRYFYLGFNRGFVGFVLAFNSKTLAFSNNIKMCGRRSLAVYIVVECKFQLYQQFLDCI